MLPEGQTHALSGSGVRAMSERFWLGVPLSVNDRLDDLLIDHIVSMRYTSNRLVLMFEQRIRKMLPTGS